MSAMEHVYPVVLQVEERSTSPSPGMKVRMARTFELIYVLQGAAKLTLEDSEWNAKHGDLFFFRPRLEYAIGGAAEACAKYVVVRFDLIEGGSGRALYDLYGEWYVPTRIRAANPVPIEAKLQTLIHEYKVKLPHYQMQTKAIMMELMVELCRAALPSSFKAGYNDEPILKVQQYLLDNARNRVSLDELSTISNVSKYHLVHRFKKMFGHSPIRYHQRIRIDKARDLIRTTDDSLSQIAEFLGFESIHTFSRTFKKVDGLPPSYYRQ